MQVWMCISKDLTPIDCVDDPHPHRAAARSLAGYSKVPATNFACRDVIIPELTGSAPSRVLV